MSIESIMSSHPLLLLSPSTLNLFHHHSLFQWVDSSHQVAKVVELQLQHQSFQLLFRFDSPWRHKELDTTEWLSTWTLSGSSFTASRIVVVVQSLSCVWLFETLWTTALQASLSFVISWSLLKLMSIELMMPSSHLKLSPSSPAFSLSQHHGLFQWVSSSHQVTEILELQL